MVLGQEIEVTDNYGGFSPVLLPMLIAGVGLVASFVSRSQVSRSVKLHQSF
jgi:K(+)-stimulated pyrophosphate-energized sodium pump